MADCIWKLNKPSTPYKVSTVLVFFKWAIYCFLKRIKKASWELTFGRGETTVIRSPPQSSRICITQLHCNCLNRATWRLNGFRFIRHKWKVQKNHWQVYKRDRYGFSYNYPRFEDTNSYKLLLYRNLQRLNENWTLTRPMEYKLTKTKI